MGFLQQLTEEVLPIQYLTEVTDFDKPSKKTDDLYFLSSGKNTNIALMFFLKKFPTFNSTEKFRYVGRATQLETETYREQGLIFGDKVKSAFGLAKMVGQDTGFTLLSSEHYFKYAQGSQMTADAHEVLFSIFAMFPTEFDDGLMHRDEKYVYEYLEKTGIKTYISDDDAERLFKSLKAAKQSIVEDARQTAKRFNEEIIDSYDIKKIQWYGSESAKSNKKGNKSNVADVIVYPIRGDRISVSLKTGEGQLKNLTAKTVMKEIADDYDEMFDAVKGRKNFMKILQEKDPVMIDAMIVNILKELLRLPNEDMITTPEEIEPDYRMKLMEITGWDDWVAFTSGDANRSRAKKFMGNLSKGIGSSLWQDIRMEYLFPVIKTVLEKEINDEREDQQEKLTKLYKKLFSVEDTEYVYISSSKLMRIPSEKRFLELLENFRFEHEIFAQGGDTILKLKVDLEGKIKDLITVKLKFRWASGQLLGDLSARAGELKFADGMDSEKVSKILNGEFD